MKDRIHQLWEKGYLYIIIASILCILYSLNKRVGVYDWRKEIAYFQYIKTSFNAFQSFPLFWWSRLGYITLYPAVRHTCNFIGNPETMLFSPLTPLLLFMNVILYIKLLYVIHFVIGVVGLFLLRKKLKWNNLQFRTYSAVFLFSPIIIQHTATGFTPWLNLFFFPLLVYFLACRRIFFSSFGISAILALILLQGGTHIFIWFTAFAILYDISNVFLERNWLYLFHILIIIMLTPLLAFARIYATTQAYASFNQPFKPGYNPINFLIWAITPPLLIAPVNMFFLNKVWSGIASWDGGIFWGLSIIMITLLIIKYKNYRNNSAVVQPDEKTGLNYDSVLVSSSILFLLSFYTIFEFLIKTTNAVLNVPFIEGAEKYPSRLAIPAFLGFSVLISHFSPGIWQTIDEWLKSNWGSRIFRRYIATPSFAKIMMYFSVVLFIVTSFAVLFTFTTTIRDTFYDIGRRFLAQQIVQIQNSPTAVFTGYSQLRLALLALGIFALIIFLILKAYLKYTPLFKKTPYTLLELTLVLPLLFSSLMWLSLAISKPHTRYLLQEVLPPAIKTSPDLADLEIKADATPQKLTLYPPEGSGIREYILTGIPAADGRFLDLISKNAYLSASDGQLSLLPLDSNPIVLEVRPENYRHALYLTFAAWLALICAFIANSLFCRRPKYSL